MLSDLQPSVQSYADVISRVTGIDVEIVDSNMVRVAGTGIYADSVGQNLARAGEVYKEVMRSRKTIQVDTPRHHAICERCPDREKCAMCVTGCNRRGRGCDFPRTGVSCLGAARRRPANADNWRADG